MRIRFRALMLGLIMSMMAQPALAQPKLADYMATPFWLEGRTVPLVMLVLERDWKMFYPAYNNLSDLDGDGALDIGFNPKVTYVGYFDSNSCYIYNRSGAPANPMERGLFVRVGPTTPQTEAEAASLAVSRGIDTDTNLTYPNSVHGVCGGPGSGTRAQGLGEWHGNWLNYAMTSRMDAIRRVLYGGKRSSDTATQTILEMVRVPANANVWGGELYADDLWEEYAPSSPWYAIELFTGFNPPVSRAMHFWARGDYYWKTPMYNTTTPTPSSTTTQQNSTTKNPKPLFRVVTNIPSNNVHPFLKSKIRHWDWTGDHASDNSIPSDGHVANSKDRDSGLTNNSFMAGGGGSNQLAWHFAAQVQVCAPGPGNISETEGCKAYGSSYKPIGLLQEYGEAGRMFFGLVTGSISHGPNGGYGEKDGYRYRGGVVRHHIQNFSNYVNESTGVIVRPGLIDTIDAFEITGISSTRVYSDGSQAGNPLGEMVWEALRYLGGAGNKPKGIGGTYTGAGGLNPTPVYGPGATEASVTRSSLNSDISFKLPKLTNWAGRPALEGSAGECPKPIILAISEVYPDHDGDDNDFPNRSDFSSVPRTSFASGNASLDGIFEINKYLKIITEHDKLRSGLSGTEFFYGGTNSLCTAKPLNDGLEEIKGHCPSEPSLQGTYSLAAVAYYAHTHDFQSLAGLGEKNEDGSTGKANNVDFYAVGIPGNFPDITLTVSDTESVTLMPIALSPPKEKQYDGTEGTTDPNFKTLLNFFIEYWQTDDGHEYEVEGIKYTRKIPYRVKFRTNFEFTTFPCFVYQGNSNNWERDLFTSTTITLLADASTPEKYRDGPPLFISSGPYKTRNRPAYIAQKKAYENAGSTGDPKSYFDPGTSGNTYYYAFKRPLGESLDLSSAELKDKVKGIAVHTDSVGSGYGSSGLSGYTISGVTFPGAYLDVGLYRLDYPIYYSRNAACTPDQSVFVPNPNGTCDEAVPLAPEGTGLPGVIYNFASGTAHPKPLTSGWTTHSSATNMSDCGYYHPPTLWDERLTPAECPYAGYTNTSPWTDPDLVAAYNPRPSAEDVCGRWAAGSTSGIRNPGTGVLSSKANNNIKGNEPNLFRTSLMRYVQVRSFKFDTSDNKPQSLPNPMWLAAKYGGFKGSGTNGLPNSDGEWKRGGKGVGAGDPYNYFGVANMSDLPTQLGNAFETIANSVATGTANASSINTVLGGGLSIQTQYNTEFKDIDGRTIKWAGSVFAYFVDKWGNLREDTNGDMKLNMVTSPPLPSTAPTSDPDTRKRYEEAWDIIIADHLDRTGDTAAVGDELGDLIVHTVTPMGHSGMPYIYLCRDMYGDNNGNTPMPTDVLYNGPGVDGYPDDVDCSEDRKSFDNTKQVWNASAFLSEPLEPTNRQVYSYYDKDGNPMVAADGSGAWPTGGIPITGYEFSTAMKTDLHTMMGQINLATTEQLIEYTRGKDFDEYRSRTVKLPWSWISNPDTPRPWIMGDVINSKPVIVGDALSNFNLLYGSKTYTEYKTGLNSDQAARRRQMAYFGANDGMLYAVNLGYFGALADGLAGYQTTPHGDSNIPDANFTGRPVGDVLWSYIPTAILPHLQWLADKNYQHGFFVDLKPYAIDITTDSAGKKWGTVLLVGLRLGGKAIEVYQDGRSTGKYSYSEFFALDVTNPDDGPPNLLWRFSHPNLGLTTASPAIVRSGNDWYAVIPSGPTEYDGTSNQAARVFVVNANTGELQQDLNPQTNSRMVVAEGNSFFSDTFAPRANVVNQDPDGEFWNHHVVYMGLAGRNGGKDTGAVYRLQMADENTGLALPVGNWKLTRMFKTNQPVTGAANAAYDLRGNLWVVFGTGRVWSGDDLAPCGGVTDPCLDTACINCCADHTQYLYGLKEPLKDDKYMTYEEILNPSIATYTPYDGSFATGDLVDVSGLEVFENGNVYADGATTSPVSYDSIYTSLVSKTAGKRGWKRKLEAWRTLYVETTDGSNPPQTILMEEEPPAKTQFEVITTQVKINGLRNGRSDSVVTSYLTSANICEPAGKSYLNVLDTNTGLPAPYYASYVGFAEGRSITLSDGTVIRQATGVKRAGDGMASEAWILKSGAKVVYGNTSFNSTRNMVWAEEMGEANGIVSWREVLDMGFDLMEKSGGFLKDLK